MLVKLESIITRPQDDEKMYMFLTEDEDVIVHWTSAKLNVEAGSKYNIEIGDSEIVEWMTDGNMLIETDRIVVLPTATSE